MRLAAWPALVILVALAGCLEPLASEAGGAAEARWWVGGGLTEDATSEDTRDLADAMAALGGEVLFLESWPMGYQVEGLTREACAQARDILAQKDYVATVGECRERTASSGGDAPVSSDGS